jgi:hypothetical protein
MCAMRTYVNHKKRILLCTLLPNLLQNINFFSPFLTLLVDMLESLFFMMNCVLRQNYFSGHIILE